MKIGLVCPYDLFKGGGVQECVLAVQAELGRRGHEVLIVAPKLRGRPNHVPDFIRLLGTATDIKSPFHTTAQISVSVDTNEVDELLESEQFDVLHFHEPWVPLLSRQLLLRSKARNIATFHAKLPDTVMSRTIEKVITPYTKSLLKYFSTMTAVSDAAATYVRTLTAAKIEIVPNGIDLEKYRVRSTASRVKNSKLSAQTIFYVGRLEKRKGVKFLLNAAKRLQSTNPEVLLRIAGDGPDRQSLERYARERGIRVEFLGAISEAEKLRELREARVFCSPARYGESFGIVLLEAMASSLPIVAGDNPGYATVLRGTGRLSLVDPRDAPEFTRKLDLMMNDQPVRQAWQAWAAKSVQQYQYKNIVDQYEALYKA